MQEGNDLKDPSLSTFQPWLEDRFLIHDTCGVHNLHGMPAVIGTIISIIMASRADEALYGKKGLGIIYPALTDHEDHGVQVEAISAGQQALNQLFAALITMAFALIGGFLTGRYQCWLFLICI